MTNYPPKFLSIPTDVAGGNLPLRLSRALQSPPLQQPGISHQNLSWPFHLKGYQFLTGRRRAEIVMKTIWPFLTAGLPFWELRQLFPWDLTTDCTWRGYLFSYPQNYLLGFTRAEQLQSTEVMPYEVRHCNLKLGIVHSRMEPIAAVWHSLAGCLGLTGGPWGHWAAAVANAAALPSCILTCCPWLPAPVLTESPEEADLHPVAQQEKAHPGAVGKPWSCIHGVQCSVVHPLTPAQPSHLRSWLSVSGLELRLGDQSFLHQLSLIF